LRLAEHYRRVNGDTDTTLRSKDSDCRAAGWSSAQEKTRAKRFRHFARAWVVSAEARLRRLRVASPQDLPPVPRIKAAGLVQEVLWRSQRLAGQFLGGGHRVRIPDGNQRTSIAVNGRVSLSVSTGPSQPGISIDNRRRVALPEASRRSFLWTPNRHPQPTPHSVTHG
jgi:hypothetical protein